MSDTDLVLYAAGDACATITVNRPNALNALNAAVLEGLAAAVDRAVADPDVRVIVLRGAGERAFIAGADIADFVGATPPDALAMAARIRRPMDAIVASPKPVVAVIHGFCLGGGLEIALACDIRIAADSAKLGVPEVKLGILPGGGGTVRLTKIAGSSVARQLCMLGEPITAQRAFDLGLLAAVHPEAELDSAADALTGRLAQMPPFALAQMKSSLNMAMHADTDTALQAEIKSFALCFSTEDQQEGAKAFLEKRKPVFRGR
ncbi:MAG: enoyl-CoA hydratase/isomerase family protein [Pararhodobacter sp.]|nr:enoyl-CoA hydratase/isomerase family protein [Pararhodobacter sp.]